MDALAWLMLIQAKRTPIAFVNAPLQHRNVWEMQLPIQVLVDVGMHLRFAQIAVQTSNH